VRLDPERVVKASNLAHEIIGRSGRSRLSAHHELDSGSVEEVLIGKGHDILRKLTNSGPSNEVTVSDAGHKCKGVVGPNCPGARGSGGAAADRIPWWPMTKHRPMMFYKPALEVLEFAR
jgi:hypothetical protein